MSEPSARCTDFCRDGGKSRGHYATTLDEMTAMARIVLARDLIATPADPADAEKATQAMMQALYEEGFGYNKIADFTNRQHEEVFGLLCRNFPGVRDPKWT